MLARLQSCGQSSSRPAGALAAGTGCSAACVAGAWWPGVGTARKACVAKTKDGYYIVTPDNGSLTHVLANNGIAEVREIDETINRLHGKGTDEVSVFHGRDLPMDKLQRAVDLSREKYCGVSAMLAKACPITHEIVVEA